MIKLDRPATPPAELQEKGSKRTEQDCSDYDAAPAEYQSRTKRFKFEDYHSSNTVRNALKSMQHGKCCYCERRLPSTDLHVEHFRPRGARRQARGETNQYPGYYWLAYDWDNLFLACPTCNIKKGTIFPLGDPSQRAHSHHDDLSAEQAMLIDPALDEPRFHICFVDDAPFPLTDKGQHTVDVLNLYGEELGKLRQEHLGYMEILLNILNLEADPEFARSPELQDAKEWLLGASGEAAPFSSMASDFLDGRV